MHLSLAESNISGDTDRWMMVQAGEVPPHQLLRAATLAVKIFKKSQESSAATRQPDSSILYKHTGRNQATTMASNLGCNAY